MAASKEVSDHDAAKRVPEYGPYGATGTPAMTKHRRTLSHAASPFLQEASGNSTNESPFARAAFRQALDRRGCLVLACRLRAENLSRICVACVGVVAQLATLFGATAAPLARVAAVVAIELIVIGVVRLVQAGGYRYEAGDSVTHAAPPPGPTASAPAGAFELESAIA
jgi:hypothetical protein